MSMNEFRRAAAKIDQHMQQLSSQGVNQPHAIINRMMGYAPDLHKIWVEASDDQLIALSNEFPGFYRYALVMEEAFEAERNKPSRPYDGMAALSDEYKELGTQLLTTAATLEHGYQILCDKREQPAFRPHFNELDKLHQQWLSDLESFKGSLRAQGAEPRVLEYVNEAYGRLAKRIKELADSDPIKPASQLGIEALERRGIKVDDNLTAEQVYAVIDEVRKEQFGDNTKPFKGSMIKEKHLKKAARIDACMRKLEAAGKNEVEILSGMADLMPDFMTLMKTSGNQGMDELCARFGGFYRYAQILENLAAGIASGDIEVPK